MQCVWWNNILSVSYACAETTSRVVPAFVSTNLVVCLVRQESRAELSNTHHHMQLITVNADRFVSAELQLNKHTFGMKSQLTYRKIDPGSMVNSIVITAGCAMNRLPGCSVVLPGWFSSHVLRWMQKVTLLWAGTQSGSMMEHFRHYALVNRNVCETHWGPRADLQRCELAQLPMHFIRPYRWVFVCRTTAYMSKDTSQQ